MTGRLAVVIDDAGLDLESQRIYEEIGVPLTLAVMPNKMYTSEAAAEWIPLWNACYSSSAHGAGFRFGHGRKDHINIHE